eukprot:141907_1
MQPKINIVIVMVYCIRNHIIIKIDVVLIIQYYQSMYHHIEHTNPNTNPNALCAIQQVQGIKAATACQIINNHVVEIIREQQMKKLANLNEINPKNPAINLLQKK